MSDPTRVLVRTRNSAKDLLQANDLLLNRVLHQLRLIVNIQLAHQVELVCFHGFHTEFEGARDLFDRFAFRQHLKNLPLALRECAETGLPCGSAALHAEIVHKARKQARTQKTPASRDLADRGTLSETLIVFLTDFGRTPRINGAAGRDHYPNVYSVALAGGGIVGGQIYGSSDSKGAFPRTQPCGPPDVHATVFHALGISPRAELRDMLGRPFPVSDGQVLPLL